MKKLLLPLLIFAGIAQAHAGVSNLVATVEVTTAGTVQMNLTWSNASCASAIATGSTGIETAGPCNAQVYRAPSTAGAACPAFSTSAYTLLSSTVSQTSSAGAYADTSIVVGDSYCWAVTDTFVAGGGASGVSATFPGTAIIVGTPATPTGLGGAIAPGS
jgi:hypothetical protein